ncbi:MAG: amidohydrolase family protein, partial [Candidatus Bathyarchaeia archaeon]
AFVNPHVHLDKCLLYDLVPPNISGLDEEGIRNTLEYKAKRYTVDEVASRAGRCLEMAALNGATSIRAFADIGPTGGLTPVRGLLKAKRDFAGVVDVQIAVIPQEGIICDPGAEEFMYKAMEEGADVVSGIPWFEWTDEDARRHIDITFEVAKKFNADLHLLCDNTDDPSSRTLEYYAMKAIREKYHGRVTCSHATTLAAYNDTYAAKVIQLVKQARMNMVNNTHIALWQGGRKDKQPIRRGITRVKELLAAGVNVSCGQDDVSDPYYPFGRMDPLEVGSFMVHTAQLGLPNEIETVYDMLTHNAAKILRLPNYGLDVGCNAELTIVDAPNAREALRLQPDRLYVIKAGRVIAETRTTRKLRK